MAEVETITVPVSGGDLAVNRWGSADGSAPVLAVHGITGNGLTWATVADLLPDHTILAPDLRGRGLSRTVPGPYGLVRHADDLVAILDEQGMTDPVVLAGHSMGAFISCVAAVRHPDRFSRLVLVDGGLGFPAPDGTDIDQVLTAVIGPAMRRLDMEFASVEAYHDFWREHPAFAELWNDNTTAYIDRDLIGTAPHLRSACVAEAVRTDGADVLNAETVAAIHKLPVPAAFLWAQRGMLDGPNGLFSAELIEHAHLPESVSVRLVPDTNHYSIALGAKGAPAVADAIRNG